MFNSEEIQLLMDALDALKSKQSRDAFAGGLLSMMLSRSQEEAEANAEKVAAELNSSRDELLADRIILLKAKLIQMRDVAEADEVAKSVFGGMQ